MKLGSPIELEMGYSINEFTRVLPLAMRDWPVSGDGLQWRVGGHDSKVDISIRLAELAERRIGALSLPVLKVTIRPGETSDVVFAEFMRRFERGFHRGGG